MLVDVCVFSHTRPPTSQHPRPVCPGVSAQLLKLQTFHWNISLIFLLRVVTCTLMLGATPWMLDSMEWLFSVAIIFSSLADTLPARPVHCFYCRLAFCSILTLMPRFFSFILEPQWESFFCCYLTPLCLTLWRILPYSIVTAFLLHLEVNMFPYIQMFAFLDRNEGVSACRLHWPVGLDWFWFTHSGKKLSCLVLLMLSLWLVSTLGHVAVQLKLDPSPATITLFKQSNTPAEIGSNKFTVLCNFPKHTHHSLLHEMNQLSNPDKWREQGKERDEGHDGRRKR